MESNLERLQKVFNEAFEDCPSINLETKKSDIETWDSMSFLNLIVELEDEFDRQFTVDEMEKMDSVAGILDIIK